MIRPLILSLAIVFGACSSGATNTAAHASEAALSPSEELPLPTVPDSLRQPAARATYLLAHFWDAMDFADTALTRNSQFMERNFANFVNLYPHAIADSLPSITGRFLRRATTDTPSRLLLYDIIDRYLNTPDSPVQSDDAYITFLSQWVELPGIDKYELEEPRYRLASALKNRPGTRAADFRYRTIDGAESSLDGTAANRLLMVLYDPDCDHCTETMSALAASPEINELIESGKLKVLAVRVEGPDDLWQQTAHAMPANWTVGTDLTGVLDAELYDIPEMPGLYLLDADKTVLLRQPPLGRLLQTLTAAP